MAKTQAHNALQQHPAASRKDPGSAAGTTTSGTVTQSLPPSNTNALLAPTPAPAPAPSIIPVNNQAVDPGGMAPARSTQGRVQTFSHAQNDIAKTTAGTKLSTNITALSESGRHSAVLHGTVAKLHPQGYRTPLQQSAQQSLMATPVARSMGPLLPQSIRHDHTINPHQAAIQIADTSPGESVLLHQKARHTPMGVVISSYTGKNNHQINMHMRLDVENTNKTPVGITNKVAALMPQVVVPNAAIQASQSTAANGLNSPATLTASGVNLLLTGSAPLLWVANPSVATTNSSAIQESWNQLAPIDLTQPGWQHVIAGRIRQTQQGSMLQIQVHPHHLGPISMQTSNGANGVISVWLQASNPQTQALLQQALPHISQSLSSLGSNASVEVSTNAFGAFGSGAQGHTPNHGRTGESSSRPSPTVPKNPESLAIDSVTSTVSGFESWI
ncbi:flagellar hook-length control protein FliK [Acidithiobacillus sp. MC6.1]|nr:flagellar hook-length control protein FliK [Acidithiobacillus sp. MC6.1]